jgi:phosphoribosylamine--glycine ligase
MNILIIGSGGREHAIGKKLLTSKHNPKLFFLPGNGGTSEIGTNISGNFLDFNFIHNEVIKNNIDLVVVGPEDPLVHGISDFLEEKGVRTFGPKKKGAQLEGSKLFSKEFMINHNIPTARFSKVISYDMGIEELKRFDYPVVIKADGLAAGKGVFICKNEMEAVDSLKQIFIDKIFPNSDNLAIIEQFISGYELSYLCLVDNNSIVPLETVRDHKKIFEGETGPNTGGMGTISPNDKLDKDIINKINELIVEPTFIGLKRDRIDYRGIIFIGVMIDDKNNPYVLEYNVRFGDPETQVLMSRLESDLVDVFNNVIDNKLHEIELNWDSSTSVCVVLASEGYPGNYIKNIPITIEKLENSDVIHAGTIIKDGELVTSGGRVLNVLSKGINKHEARKNAYEDIEKIHFKGKTFRKDIGL